MGAVFILRFVLFAPYFLPPPAREAAIRMLAASGEIPIPSQHLCRGFLHGNEDHIWHHRPSFQPARSYPASRQAAGAEVSQAKRGRTPTGYQRQISAVTSPNDLRIHKVFPASFVIVSAKIWRADNCEAPLSQRFLIDFWCGGCSLAGARQRRQGKKRRKDWLRGGWCSAPLSLSSSPVSWPAKQCCFLLRPSPGGSLAPFGGLGALARRLFLSARMRCSSESLMFNFQGS